jgi:hypothetical protein
MWPVKHGQLYATEIERWIYANLLAELFERVEELKSLDIEDPLEEIAMTRRFRSLSSKEQLAAICESAMAIFDPFTPIGGYNAILAEAGALPFEFLKAQIKIEIEAAQELEANEPIEGLNDWRRKTLLYFYGLQGLSLVDRVESVLEDESDASGELTDADLQACSNQAQDIVQAQTYASYPTWLPQSPNVSDYELWEDLIENDLMDDRLFRDLDWLMDLPKAHPELSDAAVLELQIKKQELQDAIGIETSYFDNALSKHLLKPLPDLRNDLRNDLEKYWIAPHLKTPAIVYRILKAVGQEQLLHDHLADQLMRRGDPKRVQDLLKKTALRENCHLALKIVESAMPPRIIPIKDIQISYVEPVYGMGHHICEFETEERALAMGDPIGPENLEEVVVFTVEEAIDLTDE